MSRPDRAECPHCSHLVKVNRSGLLRVHGPVRDRCWGSTLDTHGWVPVPTREGVVLAEPRR